MFNRMNHLVAVTEQCDDSSATLDVSARHRERKHHFSISFFHAKATHTEVILDTLNCKLINVDT